MIFFFPKDDISGLLKSIRVGGCARVGRCGGMLGGGGMRRPKSGQNPISTPVAANWYQVSRGSEGGKSKVHLHSNEWRCNSEHHRTWVKSVNKLAFGTTTHA